MTFVYPDYYEHFRCIGGSCTHNCCIGWEIDIDPDTAAYYEGVSGPMGRRLNESISRETTPHFILGPGERCPFLNRDDLCDIILTLGEEHICQICTDHPRFQNEYDDRVEVGLGLCCEEAGRLILGQTSPMQLDGAPPAAEDPLLSLRDRAIALLQDRSRTVPRRVQDLLDLCLADPPSPDMGCWARFLRTLERLDEDWSGLLVRLESNWNCVDLAGFDDHMARRQTEYEQFLVYLVYRHMVNALDDADLSARARFAALGYGLLYHLGAVIWSDSGQFSFAQQVELARLFSSELEYSEENLDAILEQLSFAPAQ